MMKIINCVILFVFSFLMFSCEENENVEETEIENPRLILSEDIITFNTNNQTKQLYLYTSSQNVAYETTAIPDWVSLDKFSGSFQEKTSLALTFNLPIDAIALEGSGELVIETLYETKTINLNYLINENSSYELSTSFLEFDYVTDENTFVITNNGNVDLNYSLTTSADYIQFHNEKGIIGVGEKIELIAIINREALLFTETYDAQIFVELNDVEEIVEVQVQNFKEQKLKLEGEIIDAEFSKVKGKLVYVKSDLTLNIFDVNTKNSENILLSFMPTCVSLSTDGNYALVGHDSKFSYVDLINGSVINIFEVSSYVFDIVLGDNNWAYVIPRILEPIDQEGFIRSFDLGANEVTEILSTDFFFGETAIARMSIDGNFIYCADISVSPSDIHKYDIRNGIAEYMYDSPYHGDYSFDENFWFSEDGNRIFTRGENVFKTSSFQDQDLIYNGSIELENTSDFFTFSINSIEWLEHSEIRNNLYLISSGDSSRDGNKPYIFVYNSENFIQKDKIELEKYVTEEADGQLTFYETEPHFVFSNSNGEEIYVITKAIDTDLKDEWAIQTFNIE